jgi:hypothetical protein
MKQRIYLKSYVQPSEFLQFDLSTHRFNLVGGLPANVTPDFGAFVATEGQVFGLFRSANGPVLFWNDGHLVAAHKTTYATISSNQDGTRLFTLFDYGRALFTALSGQPVLFTNPYDAEPEDVDLFDLVVQGLAREQFFINYTDKTQQSPCNC